MLLLDQENNVINSVRQIAIISNREGMRTSIAQLLRTRGFENIKIIDADFFSENTITFSAEETIGVIVDIKNESDLKTISQRIYSVIPQNVWCCVFGENDSISLSQQLLNEGILYFHSGSQLNQMIEKISSGVNIPLVRHTVKICVLGCKGGIGASLISSHIANEIATNIKVPVLLAQGPNGSQDLDLLFDKKLQNDIVQYTTHLDLFSDKPDNLSNTEINKYNFIIYDQPIFNVNKEDFSPFLEYTNTFLLIVERRINSLRVAKQFLDECERVRNVTKKPVRTFICISDNRLDISKSMARTDIETLLKCPVDAVIPFLKQTDSKNILSINLGRAGKKEIDTLTMKITGMVSRNKKRENNSLFSSLYQSFMKK